MKDDIRKQTVIIIRNPGMYLVDWWREDRPDDCPIKLEVIRHDKKGTQEKSQTT